MHKSLSSFIFLFAIFTISYSPKISYANFNDEALKITIPDYLGSLLPRNLYFIEIFNEPNVSETHFTLRFSSYGEVSGCSSMGNSHVKKKRVNNTIRLKVTDSQIELDDRPRYGNHDCKINRNKSFFDVELDRDELIKKKIKYIELNNTKYGYFGKIKVKINKYKIKISGKSSKSKGETIFWFFPKNSVVLHAPSAKLRHNVQELIRKFGVARGLEPIEGSLENFKLSYSANNYVLFTDPANYITRQLESVGENKVIGKITPTRTIYDANGAKEQPYNLDVYATLPGQNK